MFWQFTPSEELLCVSNKTLLFKYREVHKESPQLKKKLVLQGIVIFCSFELIVNFSVKSHLSFSKGHKCVFSWKKWFYVLQSILKHGLGAARGFLRGEVGSAYSSEHWNNRWGDWEQPDTAEAQHKSNRTSIQIFQWKFSDSVEEWTREIPCTYTLISEGICLLCIIFRNMVKW